MDPSSIDLTIACARGLKPVALLGRNQPFAVAYVHPSHRCTTKVALDGGGSNPVWNEKHRVLVPAPVLQRGDGVLTIEIHNRGTLGNRLIGTVQVPLAEVLAGRGEEGTRYVTYQVRRPSGKPHGSLSFSAKLVQETLPREAGYPQVQPAARPNQDVVMAYPAYDPRPAPQYLPVPPVNSYPSSLYPPQYASYNPPPNAYQPYPQGSGYTPVVVPPQRAGNRFGNGTPGLGAGLLGGALGGLLLGDLLGSMSYNAGYDQGFDAGFDGGDWGGGDWGGGFDM